MPEYDPFPTADADGSDAPSVCTPIPHDIGVFPPDSVDPASFETETGYDHRGGMGDDNGVIHHEAFISRVRDENTLLTFQDFRGAGAIRTPGTTYQLEDEFCDPSQRRCCDEPSWCTDVEVCGSSEPCLDPAEGCDPESSYCCETWSADTPCCEQPICENDDYSYLDCDLCVLYLIDCPYESLGGCKQVFIAVAGEITFEQFEKPDSSWSQDTLDLLSVTMSGLKFREVIIDPSSFSTLPACPTRSCPAHEGETENCLTIGSYSFSYDASE